MTARMFLMTACAACVILSGCVAFSSPLEGAIARPVALRFGMHVTPSQEKNPIHPPEEFTGYHAGLDYEIFASELDKDVFVYAICEGEIIYSGFAAGYGGLLVERCTANGETVSVIYGHLDEKNLVKPGTYVRPGAIIGKLAPARSQWSGGNRKHLHLGIHRGEEIDVRGYVQSEDELEAYIDPRSILAFTARGLTVKKFVVR